ncbi:MAG: class I SAM-dependent methyltransferase [Calothrix sp. FI2-JRJ7]|nr:class I SAM-dependent methyltransferase [Calothrix sp. FI2-JRJ7]
MKSLLTDAQLEASEVVANCLMNRQRQLTGSNSYVKELGFNPLSFITTRIQNQKSVAWLDICCGTGRALIHAAESLYKLELTSQTSLVGVDIVSQFYPYPPELINLELLNKSIHTFTSSRKFDLITCVHGLHYLGDKLKVLEHAASWLNNNGLLIAHLDLANLWIVESDKLKPMSQKLLSNAGLKYNNRKKLCKIENSQELMFELEYLGADDCAGANYTGQPAVNSFYMPNSQK